MAMVNGNKSNRRVAFRVYEQANLFYHKIDQNQVLEPQVDFDNILTSFTQSQITSEQSSVSGFSSVDQSLPDSQSLENDTLNVNISSSGIAFTCKDELKKGDYLMIRILLLSSMTVITTCCKVVYCKPSNPYENDRHPYLIGVHFVNLTAEDTELLNRYVSKRKKQQLVANGVFLAFAMIVLAMPDLVFGLLLGVYHHGLEVVLHIVHLAFEFIESNLDHLIEHTLHTDLHDTQVIAFYTLVSCGFVGLYFFWRIIPPACVRFRNSQMAFWARKKASFLYYWAEQTSMGKIKIVMIGIAAITCYSYFAI
jgi:hypothetical protein